MRVNTREARGNISLDNVAISSSQFNSIPNFPDYKYTIKQIGQGAHHITDNSHNRFLVYLYGFGTRESYGYTIGSAARAINDSSNIVPSYPDSSTLWVPNIFTPDRQDNREFLIYGTNLLDAEVAIFHRWGMFLTRFDGLTETWDGTHNGKPCPTGAYVYKITYHTLSEPFATKTAVGTVVLLR